MPGANRPTMARLGGPPRNPQGPGPAWVEEMNNKLPEGVPGFTYRMFDYWCRTDGYITLYWCRTDGYITLAVDAKGSGSRRQISEAEEQALLAMVVRLHEIDQATREVTSGDFFARAMSGEENDDDVPINVLVGILDNLRTLRRLKEQAARVKPLAIFRAPIESEIAGLDLAISVVKEYL